MITREEVQGAWHFIKNNVMPTCREDGIDCNKKSCSENCLTAQCFNLMEVLINDYFSRPVGIVSNGENAKNIVIEKDAYMHLNIGVKKND